MVALLALAARPCAADVPEFSAQSVFALPDRANIDNRCSDARKFADKAAQGTDSLSADDAIAAANAFAACYRLPRLNPDVDQQRYLVLSSAAALYLAATKTTGAESEALYKKADSVAALLGGAPPDRSNGLKPITNDTTRAGSSTPEEQVANALTTSTQGIIRQDTVYTDARDPHGAGQKLKFTEIATQLRSSAYAHLGPPPTLPAAHPSSSP